MYAIIKAGGRQYRVEAGETIRVDGLDAPEGERVTLNDVLVVAGDGPTRVGTPRVEAASVVATVVKHGRQRKIRVFKFKRRKHYRRTKGHRQPYTAVRIESIQV